LSNNKFEAAKNVLGDQLGTKNSKTRHFESTCIPKWSTPHHFVLNTADMYDCRLLAGQIGIALRIPLRVAPRRVYECYNEFQALVYNSG